MKTFFILLQVLIFPATSFAVDYYISAAGNDANAGTSSAAPWRTLNKVNALNLRAGDRVFLRGGDTFTGPLNLDAGDAGTPSAPIHITSYGTGVATISAGTGNGIYAYNTAGIRITNLKVVGSGASNTGAGIYFFNYLSGNTKLDTVLIDGVEATGFYDAGIQIGAWNGASGYRNVRITNSRAHGNLKNGVTVWGYSANGHSGFAHENVYIGNVQAYRNTGITGVTDPTGNGIVISGTDGGVIEHCLAYENGANNTSKSGPVGIWAWHANNIKIQFNEAYNNRTTVGAADGGGFDLDGAVSNSVMQYNYSHGNDGAGYLIAQYANAPLPLLNNVIRYNISQNDGRKNGYGGIFVWSGSTNGMGIKDLEIYNNTIFLSPAPNGTPTGINLVSPTENTRIRNNIIVTTSGVPLLNVVAGQKGLVIQNNSYWASGGAFRINYLGKAYTSLADFRTGTGMERLGTTAVGFDVDPKLSNPGSGAVGHKLQSSSPLINKGLNLSVLSGVNMGERDYFGSSLPQGEAYDLGAHEFLLSSGGPTPGPGPGPVEPPPPPADPENLLVNADFESNLYGWENWGNSAVVASHGVSGSAAVRTGTGAGGVAQEIAKAVSAGKTYQLEAQAKLGNSAEQAWVGVKFTGSSGAVLLDKNVRVTSTALALYGLDFSVPVGATHGYVYLWKSAGTSYAYADNFLLVERSGSDPTPPPTPPPPPEDPGVDTEAPVVTVTTPANGATVARKAKVSLTASATDNVGVTKVDFYVSGKRICSVSKAPYSCTWTVPNKAGSAEIYAQGFDQAGNVGSSSKITVTIK